MVSRSPNAQPIDGMFAASSVRVPARQSASGNHDPTLAAEQEIARLTWAVLDGKATLEDRRRLAELVGRQHSLRHQNES